MVPRLCNNAFYAGVLVLGCLGCSGQNIEGRWEGRLPFETSSNCQIRLAGSGGFDASCKGEEFVGDGRYFWDGKELTLSFARTAVQGRSRPLPEPMKFEVVGHGNDLTLKREGATYGWHRTLK